MPLTREKTVALPRKLIQDLVVRSDALREAQERLEDYCLGNNKRVIASLRRARRDHNAGRTISFDDLKHQYV